MRPFLKWLGIIPLLALFGLLSAVICLVPLPQKGKRAVAARIVSFCSRILLRLLGIRVIVRHPERLRKNADARLIVSNHLSYLDVFIISSLLPSVFITSIELRDTALLGPLARLSGCLFVERRKASGLKEEIGEIARTLAGGIPVAFFPEGTTSNGDRVMQFKNSLFDSAVRARADVLPLCLRYTGVNGGRLTPVNRDGVYYYGGITFFEHFPRLLKLASVDVEVLPHKPLGPHARLSRKELAAEAHRLISEAYRG